MDIPPYEFGSFNIDGTALLNILTTSDSSFLISFNAPIQSFAIDLAEFQDEVIRTQLVIDGQVSTPSIGTNFIGFTSDTGVSVVEFRGVANDGFSLDNLTYGLATTTVPEPMSVLLIALAGLMMRVFRKS